MKYLDNLFSRLIIYLIILLAKENLPKNKKSISTPSTLKKLKSLILEFMLKKSTLNNNSSKQLSQCIELHYSLLTLFSKNT